ncbi:MAG: type II toxin-antitoxin system VapC family toxin [Oscillospiraceae bacterium]|nr:type II toxin-antitoxin system VapC family toxin [Oscillospiraceae bacterium]
MGNVGYLLDTCAFLWSVQRDVKLGGNARALIEDVKTPLFLSAVSAYEIMYKHRIGKLPEYEDIANDYFSFVQRLNVAELPINTRHTHLAGKANWEHRDPFDRLLAAQASIENLTLITNDPAFETIRCIKTLW